MNVFRNERLARVLRPTLASLALIACLWHATHAGRMWEQSRQYRASDPALADFFWAHFQKEVGVSLASMMAGLFAWHLFRPRQHPMAPENASA